MRVANQRLAHQIFSLRLDQSTFQLAMKWVGTVEKLKHCEQNVIFLNRCRKASICCTSLRNPVRFPRTIRDTAYAQRCQREAESRSLQMLIRYDHLTIDKCKVEANHLRERLKASGTEYYRNIYNIVQDAAAASKSTWKNTLKQKYTRLVTQAFSTNLSTPSHAPATTHADTSAHHADRPSNGTSTQGNDGPSPRISILGDVNLPDETAAILAKGPKFAITPSFSGDKLQRQIQTEVAVLAYGLRWRTALRDSAATGIGNTFNIMNQDCPFNVKRRAPPRDNSDMEKSIKHFVADMERITRSASKHLPKPNTSQAELQSIKSLRDRKDVHVTKSDKGGEMVVMRDQDMRRLCQQHLDDPTTYTKLQKDPTPKLRLTINKTLKRILEAREFPSIIVRRLQTPPEARTQQFYALPKTHKPTLKIRPIVSGCGGVFERIGWLLQFILKPLLQHVRAHIASSQDLLKRFKECDTRDLQGKIPISFDVVSLYTNIDISEAIDTALEYAQQHNINTFNLSSGDLHELLTLTLRNNVFHHPDIGIFQQIRGLAMGSKLSGTLAILAMDRFEQAHVYRDISPPLSVFIRYVDDSGTVIEDATRANAVLQHLNQKHPTIKFELELPDAEGYLPILDLKLKIQQDGTIIHKLYTKKANKGITLHADSHHPTAVKTAVIKNEYKRATENSTADLIQTSREQITNKLLSNGYTIEGIARAQRRRPARHRHNSQEKQLVLKIPYISDKVNGQVRNSLKKNNIKARVVNPRPPTLLQLSKKKKEPERCRMRDCPIPYLRCCSRYIVYQAFCDLCPPPDNDYIGSTKQQLHSRAQQHINAAKHHDRTYALGEHYAIKHPNPAITPRITFRILQTTPPDELRLRIVEAYAIQVMKPALNRKREDMGTGFLA